jgi:hypothetical protein
METRMYATVKFMSYFPVGTKKSIVDLHRMTDFVSKNDFRLQEKNREIFIPNSITFLCMYVYVVKTFLTAYV